MRTIGAGACVLVALISAMGAFALCGYSVYLAYVGDWFGWGMAGLASYGASSVYSHGIRPWAEDRFPELKDARA